MRKTYQGLPADAVRKMLGGNAARAYGFDLATLEQVAARIGAPTLDELSRVVEGIPPHWGLAFRDTEYYV
jgi:hypothetical protein